MSHGSYLRLGRRFVDFARSNEWKYAASSSRAWCEMPPHVLMLVSLVVDDSDVLDDDGVRGRCEAVAWSNECWAEVRTKYDVCDWYVCDGDCTVALSEKSNIGDASKASPGAVLLGRITDGVCDAVDCDVGDVGVDEVALSRSARRHACEQYTFPLHSRSQARQKSRKQSIVCA